MSTTTKTLNNQTQQPFSIGRMLHPILPEDFFSEYYEKKPCIIARDSPNFYHHLLTLETIDNVLSSQTLRFPKVKLVNSALAEQPKAEAFTTNGTDIHPARFLRHYTEGCTMVFSSLHERVASLGVFCDHMSKYFSHGFQTNIYLTPPNAQGFNPHYDTHDVFILQVEGSKLWRLFDTPIDLPLKSQPFELKRVQPGPVSHEFVLNAGDMLYIPRGLMHDAETTGELSMHITAGLLGFTYADMLVEAILNMATNHAELRKNLPVGHARNTDAACKEVKEKATEMLQRLVETMNVGAGLDRFTEKLQSELQPNLPGQFRQVRHLGQVTTDTVVRRRPEVWYRRSADNEKCRLHIYGQNIEFPAFTAPAIDHLDQHATFMVNELPNCMDDNGKVVFIKRLIKEGLLVQDLPK